jgi:hypothetical protein
MSLYHPGLVKSNLRMRNPIKPYLSPKGSWIVHDVTLWLLDLAKSHHQSKKNLYII